MTTSGVRGAVVTKAKPVTSQFQFGPWTLTAVKSHILESEGPARQRFENELELPQVPEMIFADNVLRVQHDAGYGVEFNALDALKMVDAQNDPLKVAVAQAWKEARADCEHINEVVKPFDWTFTTEYKGTLIGKDGAQLQVEKTDERIDLEKLKVREKIHFYEDILLFEDELSDNGSSLMNVKIRVMPTSFFILLRQFMRVDNVVVRVLDTRLHHEAEKDFILREHSYKDSNIQDIKGPAHVVTDPNQVAQLLPVRTETFEKLIFPTCSTKSTEADAIR
ncbi:TIP41-like protein [Mercenaria mercenaria]|uniref:TIP41-like protein n=1 Tax=Mercenaria mercenaria TaxID=6596 RepID=UPI001E1DB7A6|nr:TIP41-like protein [Mercenaria mercenaria]